MQDIIWDTAIIGAGPAGLTAGIYTTRGALSTVIIGGSSWGGQLMRTSEVDNFPGFPNGIMGPDLMEKMRAQALRFGAEFIQDDVTAVDFSVRPFVLTVHELQIFAHSVIIATGAETKWLGIKGEKELIGRGISSCAPCDAPFFKEKHVLVVGGGDSAMEEALALTKYASKITIIHRKSEFEASQLMQEKVFANNKINVIWDSEVEEIAGNMKLESVKLKNNKTNEITEIKADGLFVAIGHNPTSKLFKGLIDLDKNGYIKIVNAKNPSTKYKTMTNIEGVFASGDIHDHFYRQAVTAAGYGCMAGMEAVNYIANLQKN